MNLIVKYLTDKDKYSIITLGRYTQYKEEHNEIQNT